MKEEPKSAPELLEEWREATRAAELAERLAKVATESAQRADRDAMPAAAIAKIAERAAGHAERAAHVARQAADRAATFARENRAGYWADAQAAVTSTKADETAARDRYHEAERGGNRNS